MLGPNGCGKSCLLKALADREVPIPSHVDVYLLEKEIAGTDMTALEAVTSVDEEKGRLEREAEALVELEMTEEVETRLSDVYERWVAARSVCNKQLHNNRTLVTALQGFTAFTPMVCA